MVKSIRKLGIPAIAVLAASLTLPAQTPLFRDPNQPVEKNQQVSYLFPEQITLPAGKPQSVTLHFRVAPGLHINSHAPSDPSLIPTVLSVPGSSGVTLQSARYPQGVPFILPVDPSTKLSVYTGDFAIETRLVATPGDHLVQAHLRFQACDENACMPPRTITAPIDVIAK
ncbi:MAG: protein-disulfide reductase DsbD domain-containing protein [Terracidiphilus sp.]